MSNNIIAHLIFFPLHTFLILHIPRFPTTTYLKSRPHVLVQQTTIVPISLFAFHLFLQYSLSLSLSLSLSWICAVQEARAAKKKPQLMQTSKTQEQQKISLNWSRQTITNLLIFGLLWFCAFSTQYNKSDIFFYFLLSKR